MLLPDLAETSKDMFTHVSPKKVNSAINYFCKGKQKKQKLGFDPENECCVCKREEFPMLDDLFADDEEDIE